MIGFATERPLLFTCYCITVTALLSVASDLAHGAWSLWRCEAEMRRLARARRVTGGGR